MEKEIKRIEQGAFDAWGNEIDARVDTMSPAR